MELELNLVGLAAIITALVGVFKFFDDRQSKKNGEAIEKIGEKIDNLQEKMEAGQKKDELAITRLELMTLISNDPKNKVEIEKLGRHYFSELEGNTYMSSVFSSWCDKYGGDTSIVIK